MTTVVLALGSNLGDRAGNLQGAVRLLEEAGVVIKERSSIWETPPMPEDQPWFLNAVVVGETDFDAEELLAAAKDIEWRLGRRPNRRWGPRPIDVDVLFFGAERVETDALTVPHPGIAERGFVLAPLAEVFDGPLPVLGERALTLLSRVDQSGLRRAGTLPA